jgi:hypothetical protein
MSKHTQKCLSVGNDGSVARMQGMARFLPKRETPSLIIIQVQAPNPPELNDVLKG